MYESGIGLEKCVDGYFVCTCLYLQTLLQHSPLRLFQHSHVTCIHVRVTDLSLLTDL